MTFGVVIEVEAPVEMYDALHREVVRLTHAEVEGLLLHVGRAKGSGFEVIELWTDREQYERYNQEVVWPAAARLTEGRPGLPPELRTEEFEVRGLVLPAAHLVE